jgi:YbbR domain-containing protein
MAFVLSMVVWISAVVAADPNVEQTLNRGVSLEIEDLEPGLLIMNAVPEQVRLTLNAPNSRWRILSGDSRSVRAWIDLEGLGPGEHLVGVQVQSAISPVRVVSVEPPEILVVLEPQVMRSDPIQLVVEGEPALGYTAGEYTLSPEEVVISGPASQVAMVHEVQAYLEIAGERQTVEVSLPLRPLDMEGEEVGGVFPLSFISVRRPADHLAGRLPECHRKGRYPRYIPCSWISVDKYRCHTSISDRFFE